MPDTACCPVDLQEGLERAGGDREFYRELLQMMMDEAPTQLAAIRQGLAENNASAVSRAAHGLKGAAANLAAHDVRDVASRLEAVARDGETGSLPALADELAQRLDQLGTFLESFS